MTPSEAAALLLQLTSHEAHRFVGELPPLSVEVFARSAGHQQTTDAYLVQAAEHHAARVITFDAPLRQHAGSSASVTVIAI